MKENNKQHRTVFRSDEFDEYYNSLDERTQSKFEEGIYVLETIYVLSQKFVKKIENSNFYELRVSVGFNEYRTILFSVNHENIIQATEIVLLNSFLKKDKKDYAKQVKRATNIYNNLEDEKD